MILNEKKPKPGDTVYSVNGCAAEYIAPYSGGHVVAILYETEEEVRSGDVVQWDHVYAEPPKEKLDVEIKKRFEEAACLRTEVSLLRAEKVAMENARVVSLKEMSKHAALARIEDYLAGRFTYFVEVPPYGCPSIKMKDAILKGGGCDQYDRSLKLLTLFGKSNGDLQWNVSRYYDGSGGGTEVIPVADEAEGLVIIRAFYAGHVAEWRADHKKSPAITWSRQCPAGMIDVPADVALWIKEVDMNAMKAREAEKLKELCEIRAKMADAAK
jgi:hypothetical protein